MSRAERARHIDAIPAAGCDSWIAENLSLGLGDLFVMGGTCQRTWQHGIPKVARAAPRVAVMFRPVWTRPDDLTVRRLLNKI